MPARTPRFRLFWRTFGWQLALVAALAGVWWLALGALWAGSWSATAWASPLMMTSTLAGAAAVTAALLAAVARQINRPFSALSEAAERLRDGDLDSRLDEEVVVREIREVNAGFNRMARELARVEQDRAVMLAGISHDLRTPLARLRLEAEMSVSDPQALAHIAADIQQLDAIIDKFTEYARPQAPSLGPVDLRSVLGEVCERFAADARLQVHMQVPEGAQVIADATDLRRVVVNLVENAGRYARAPDTGRAEVTVSADISPEHVVLCLQDRGPGVPEAQLGLLTQPFFRGNTARTEASGAGLGLAIVDKAVQRMRGRLDFRNLPGRGLEVRITLPRALAAPPAAPTPPTTAASTAAPNAPG